MTHQEKFLRAFLRGDELCRVTGVYGRIVRTTLDRPLKLAEEHERRVVMVTGPHGLRQLLGACGYQSLVKIGYKPAYIERNLARGMKFKLVLFDKPAHLRIATWKVAIEVVSEYYPELATVLHSSLADLKSTTLEQFEEGLGYKFADVQAAGKTDPRFMTAQRLLKSNRTAADVRAFLFHALYFSDLYSGDGYTKTHDGKRGVREYLMPNLALTSLSNCSVTEMDVQLPDPQDCGPRHCRS